MRAQPNPKTDASKKKLLHCAVLHCKNVVDGTHRTCRRLPCLTTGTHPTRQSNADIVLKRQRAWLIAIGRPIKKSNYPRTVVCLDHFQNRSTSVKVWQEREPGWAPTIKVCRANTSKRLEQRTGPVTNSKAPSEPKKEEQTEPTAVASGTFVCRVKHCKVKVDGTLKTCRQVPYVSPKSKSKKYRLLVLRRQAAWFAALEFTIPNTECRNSYVCLKHFITSVGWNTQTKNHPNFAPTLHLRPPAHVTKSEIEPKNNKFSCAVLGCKNKVNGFASTCRRLPVVSDAKTAWTNKMILKRQHAWIQAIGRDVNKNKFTRTFVCLDHFTPRHHAARHHEIGHPNWVPTINLVKTGKPVAKKKPPSKTTNSPKTAVAQETRSYTNEPTLVITKFSAISPQPLRRFSVDNQPKSNPIIKTTCAVKNCHRMVDGSLKTCKRLPVLRKGTINRTHETQVLRRQTIWLDAIGRHVPINQYPNTFVCLRHFRSEASVKIGDLKHPDWAPTLSLGKLNKAQDTENKPRYLGSHMRYTCAVVNCNTKVDGMRTTCKRLPTISPKAKSNKYIRITLRQQRAWLKAIGKSIPVSRFSRTFVCLKHFYTRSNIIPSLVYDRDWAPSINVHSRNENLSNVMARRTGKWKSTKSPKLSIQPIAAQITPEPLHISLPYFDPDAIVNESNESCDSEDDPLIERNESMSPSEIILDDSHKSISAEEAYQFLDTMDTFNKFASENIPMKLGKNDTIRFARLVRRNPADALRFAQHKKDTQQLQINWFKLQTTNIKAFAQLKFKNPIDRALWLARAELRKTTATPTSARPQNVDNSSVIPVDTAEICLPRASDRIQSRRQSLCDKGVLSSFRTDSENICPTSTSESETVEPVIPKLTPRKSKELTEGLHDSLKTPKESKIATIYFKYTSSYNNTFYIPDPLPSKFKDRSCRQIRYQLFESKTTPRITHVPRSRCKPLPDIYKNWTMDQILTELKHKSFGANNISKDKSSNEQLYSKSLESHVGATGMAEVPNEYEGLSAKQICRKIKYKRELLKKLLTNESNANTIELESANAIPAKTSTMVAPDDWSTDDAIEQQEQLKPPLLSKGQLKYKRRKERIREKMEDALLVTSNSNELLVPLSSQDSYDNVGRETFDNPPIENVMNNGQVLGTNTSNADPENIVDFPIDIVKMEYDSDCEIVDELPKSAEDPPALNSIALAVRPNVDLNQPPINQKLFRKVIAPVGEGSRLPVADCFHQTITIPSTIAMGNPKYPPIVMTDQALRNLLNSPAVKITRSPIGNLQQPAHIQATAGHFMAPIGVRNPTITAHSSNESPQKLRNQSNIAPFGVENITKVGNCTITKTKHRTYQNAVANTVIKQRPDVNPIDTKNAAPTNTCPDNPQYHFFQNVPTTASANTGNGNVFRSNNPAALHHMRKPSTVNSPKQTMALGRRSFSCTKAFSKSATQTGETNTMPQHSRDNPFKPTLGKPSTLCAPTGQAYTMRVNSSTPAIGRPATCTMTAPTGQSYNMPMKNRVNSCTPAIGRPATCTVTAPTGQSYTMPMKNRVNSSTPAIGRPATCTVTAPTGQSYTMPMKNRVNSSTPAIGRPATCTVTAPTGQSYTMPMKNRVNSSTPAIGRPATCTVTAPTGQSYTMPMKNRLNSSTAAIGRLATCTATAPTGQVNTMPKNYKINSFNSPFQKLQAGITNAKTGQAKVTPPPPKAVRGTTSNPILHTSAHLYPTQVKSRAAAPSIPSDPATSNRQLYSFASFKQSLITQATSNVNAASDAHIKRLLFSPLSAGLPKPPNDLNGAIKFWNKMKYDHPEIFQERFQRIVQFSEVGASPRPTEGPSYSLDANSKVCHKCGEVYHSIVHYCSLNEKTTQRLEWHDGMFDRMKEKGVRNSGLAKTDFFEFDIDLDTGAFLPVTRTE